MAKYGVIDLGTNTFHLLVVEKKRNGSFSEIYRERIFVKLAENGIEKIGALPFQKGLDALKKFNKIISDFDLKELKTFGTAALRTASNGPEFVARVKAETGIQIALIDGNEEARLIRKGVAMAVDMHNYPGMIMDIGGGSVEFIIANSTQTFWAQSFPIGVAVLFKKFHKSNPISEQELITIENYLTTELSPLFDFLTQNPIDHLIGASGTFDVLEIMIPNERKNPNWAILDMAPLPLLYQQFIESTLEERLDMENLSASRAEMIIVAMVLIQFILKKCGIKQLSVTSYALKEGMLKELMD